MKRLAIAAAAVAIICLSSMAAAQSSNPIDDTFDADVQGWAAVQSLGSTNTGVTWLGYKDFGFLLWHSEAYGVLQASPLDGSHNDTAHLTIQVAKSVYLQPGNYSLHMRMATESGSDYLGVDVAGSGTTPGSYLFTATQGSWTEYATDIIHVQAPGLVTWIIGSTNGFWLDWVQVQALGGDVATPTPNILAPTPTPLAHTPIPTDQQATPIPVGTQFCQVATPTPQAPAYGSTPTAPANDWGYLDRFSGGIGQGLSISGSGVAYSDQMGPDNAQGVLAIDYSADSSPAGSLSNAFVFDQPLTPTLYLDGFAMADAIPIGASASVHVWLRDASSNWYEAGSASFSAVHWYPFHITVTDPAGATAPYSALAISVSRSDNPSSVPAFLDNLYLYGTLTRAPDCSGGYPPDTTSFVGGGLGPDNYPTTSIQYPIGKACPAPVMNIPDNFWGPFFEWSTLQFWRITAFFPDHVAHSFFSAIQTVANSPIWVYASVATMLFDLRPVLILAGLVITLEIVRLLYSIWRIILKIIPMAG
jgi:hypothetical protein